MEDSVQRIHITPINGDRSAVGAIGWYAEGSR